MRSFKSFLLGIVAVSSLSLISCASNKSAHVGEEFSKTEIKDGVSVLQGNSRRLNAEGKIEGTNTTIVQTRLMVDKIDYTSRQFTLKSADGEMIALKAGPEIRNFNQIKAGDQVEVDYLLSVAFEVRNPTPAELAAQGSVGQAMGRANLGDMPAAAVAKGVIKIATVESIDKSAQTITLRGLKTDRLTEVTAQFPENLAFVDVGDTVVITAMEGLATSVNRLN